MGLSKWVSEKLSIPDDWEWYCYQFDSAVTHFGATVQGRLDERDKDFKQKTTLKKLFNQKGQILARAPSNDDNFNFFNTRGISIE